MNTKFNHASLLLEATPEQAQQWYLLFLTFLQEQVAKHPELPPYIALSLNESTDDEENTT